MKRLALSVALALSMVPAAASAQVAVNIQVGLPVAPPLVVVQTGVQVVEDFNEEVFYTGGYYWCRRDAGWYRARGPRARFVYIEPRRVPERLVRLPPGHYRHFGREQARAEHREWKERQKAERRAWKEHEKAERREYKEERKHGHGHGHR
jgi:hypothetical protein